MTSEPEKPQSRAARVIAFLAEELALPAEKIGLLSRLRQDLGVDGVDAANLMEAFVLLFEVDDAGFRVNDYFSADGSARRLPEIFGWVLWLSGNGKPLRTLTVRDLVLAVEKGSLGA